MIGTVCVSVIHHKIVVDEKNQHDMLEMTLRVFNI